jgi:putative oxidoreductase
MPKSWTPSLLSVLRIIAAFLFLAHGTQKLFGFPAPMTGGPVAIGSLIGAAGIIEVVGGVLLFIGLFTRPVAFLLSGEMAVAYFGAHASAGFWPLLNGGELAVLYCFAFLFFAAAGGGRWSVDALIDVARRRPTAPVGWPAEERPRYRRAG